MPKCYIQVEPISDLEHTLGYHFKNKDLLRQALTHASAISEKHPAAFYRDLSSLAFVGDSALKYAVARYIFLNGRPEVLGNIAELHKGVQAVIPNRVLATIGEEAVHLEHYLIRGNAHRTLSSNMYADCMEAIFGAIALDCGTDQEVLFRVIEKLCSERYENWLVPTTTVRFASALRRHEDELVIVDVHDWNRMQVDATLYHNNSASSLDERSRWQILGLLILGLFAIFGFSRICWDINEFIKSLNRERNPIPVPQKCYGIYFGSYLSARLCRRFISWE